MKVSFSAPERYLGVLRRGGPVTISTPAYPGDALQGRIDVVEPVLDPNLRSARILARVPNPGGNLRPGMSANIVALLGERRGALTIPSEAVVVEGGQTYVFAVKPDSTVTRVAVALGTRTADRVEVLRGVDGGARVVRAGHQKLFEGAKVIPVQSAPDAAGGAPAAGGAAARPGGERR
jgi:membrane fusion protein (multidrug efflux system)